MLNRYSYCRNNPLIYTDPTGHLPDGGYGSYGKTGNIDGDKGRGDRGGWGNRENDYWGRLPTLPINTTYGEHSTGVYRNNLGNMEAGVGIRQYDPSLNTQFNKVMEREGCHVLALQYSAELWVGKDLTPGQINKSREDAAEAGIIRGYYDLYVNRPQDLIQDTLDRLGSQARVKVSGYYPDRSGEGEADYTIVRGKNPITGNMHSQLGNALGETIWDPAYDPPVTLKDPIKYLNINFD